MGSLRGAIGTPGQVTDLLARYEAAGVDQVMFVMQAGRNRHEHICESIELFAREVLPRFADGRERRSSPRQTGWRPRSTRPWPGAPARGRCPRPTR